MLVVTNTSFRGVQKLIKNFQGEETPLGGCDCEERKTMEASIQQKYGLPRVRPMYGSPYYGDLFFNGYGSIGLILDGSPETWSPLDSSYGGYFLPYQKEDEVWVKNHPSYLIEFHFWHLPKVELVYCKKENKEEGEQVAKLLNAPLQIVGDDPLEMNLSFKSVWFFKKKKATFKEWLKYLKTNGKEGSRPGWLPQEVSSRDMRNLLRDKQNHPLWGTVTWLVDDHQMYSKEEWLQKEKEKEEEVIYLDDDDDDDFYEEE